MARLASFLNVVEEANREDMTRRRNLQRISRHQFLEDSEMFRRHYRLSRELFNLLYRELKPLMKKPSRRGDISIECKILTALSFYATGSYQRIIGSSNIISQQSVSKALHEVTDALNTRLILTKFIKFPQTTDERVMIKRRFFERFGIPGVIGCIDGTHVAIIRPVDDEDRYFNRKHFHSRNVQIICDSEMNILSADATFGGATHDAFIFNQHAIKPHLIELLNRGETTYLLGDSGYPQREYMMTPILNAEAGSPEDFYTERHCATRNIVERTIGLLKARWRCLLRHRVLHYDPHTSSKIINACCVLHNLCNQFNCPVPDTTNVHSDDANENLIPASSNNDELRRGQAARQCLVQTLWESRR